MDNLNKGWKKGAFNFLNKYLGQVKLGQMTVFPSEANKKKEFTLNWRDQQW